MWLENIVGATILILGFMYLQQITTWSPDSFRLGLVIRKYKESFNSKIPKELIKKEITCNNVLFKFHTSAKGLFRVYPKPRGILQSRRKSYLPSILGEINIHSNGIAEISWRIPLSLMLIGISIFLVLVGSNLEGVYTLGVILTSIVKSLFVIAIFGVLSFIYFGYEKWDLEDGIKELNEKINSDTL
jgi:hypothetical protein